MGKATEKNRDVWNDMFEWIHSKGGHRKYTNETVVIWLLGYARTDHEKKRVLDVGCGWSQCLPLFMNEGFDYFGVDVTDKAFIEPSLIERQGWSERTKLSVFSPPKLDFPDNYFSHAISTEALHLNPDPEGMQAVIDEIYRVLQPGGRFMATLMHPDYWYMSTLKSATWVGPETIEVNETHVEKARIGARYFVFKDEDRIRHYFRKFAKVYVGHEHRVFGEYPEKHIAHWIVSVEK